MRCGGMTHGREQTDILWQRDRIVIMAGIGIRAPDVHRCHAGDVRNKRDPVREIGRDAAKMHRSDWTQSRLACRRDAGKSIRIMLAANGVECFRRCVSNLADTQGNGCGHRQKRDVARPLPVQITLGAMNGYVSGVVTSVSISS